MPNNIEVLYGRDHHGWLDFIFDEHFCSTKISLKQTRHGYKGSNILSLLVCRTRFYDARDEDVLFVYGKPKTRGSPAVLVDQAPEGLIGQIVGWLEKRYPPKN